ncbi:hypothetical protein E2C01_055471 [Portunus trituberculatus]|uniref:Uncharacterized protein n=1 Tax=Portunus trituberculatus TaxID=210409 RepID=A0A5B7GV33_PORTR|nr:hypothetical protein [Portunus trituberculatus]
MTAMLGCRGGSTLSPPRASRVRCCGRSSSASGRISRVCSGGCIELAGGAPPRPASKLWRFMMATLEEMLGSSRHCCRPTLLRSSFFLFFFFFLLLWVSEEDTSE